MRRTLVTCLLAVVTGLSGVTTAQATSAVDDPDPKSAAQREADEALEVATDILSGDAAEDTEGGTVVDRNGPDAKGPDASLALADLQTNYDNLSASGKRKANGLLARPTDGAADQFGDGYSVAEATPICGPHVCIHYVNSTSDKPTGGDGDGDGKNDWAESYLTVMESVWNYEIGTRGYRAPYSDGSRGGNTKVDVYLADVGASGYYGYCAPENRVPGQSFRYYGYCVLDNDFKTSQFPTNTPAENLKVTAAHEFFHAIQFNYDADEDRWLMEATATWMEERYADSVNDNRNYLPYSQLKRPSTPLDTFAGLEQYGNWIYFEFLSQQYGVDFVRSVWQRLDASRSSRGQYSTQAVKMALAYKKVNFAKAYAKFGAINLISKKWYTEGYYYGTAPVAGSYTLSPGKKTTGTRTTTLNHLTTRNYAFVPSATLTGTWGLRVNIDGPATSTGAANYLLLHMKNGTTVQKAVPLNSSGKGTLRVSFSRATVAKVTLTIANGSSRFTGCYRGSSISCQGSAVDNGRVTKFSAVASK